MIIDITLKDPDGIYEGIQDASYDTLKRIEGLERDEVETLREVRHERIAESLKPWIQHGEYVRIQIDTNTGTATIITNK